MGDLCVQRLNVHLLLLIGTLSPDLLGESLVPRAVPEKGERIRRNRIAGPGQAHRCRIPKAWPPYSPEHSPQLIANYVRIYFCRRLSDLKIMYLTSWLLRRKALSTA